MVQRPSIPAVRPLVVASSSAAARRSPPTVTGILTPATRRSAVAAVIAVAATGCAQVTAAPKTPATAWQTSAAQAMSTVRVATAQNETCRQVIRATVGGGVIRLRLSNAMSPTPLRLAALTVGIRSAGAALAAAPTPVTVGGSVTPVIGPRTVVTTDPIELVVAVGQDIAVTFAVKGTARLTEHPLGAATGWCSGPGTGDHAADPSPAPFAQASREGLVVEALEVQTKRAWNDGILAVGDSLTDPPLPPDSYQRWTDLVAARTGRAVANLGIGGNRVLLPGGYGPTLSQRFGRDALGRPGASMLVVFAGTNDVSDGIGAPELTARLAQLCRRGQSAAPADRARHPPARVEATSRARAGASAGECVDPDDARRRRAGGCRRAAAGPRAGDAPAGGLRLRRRSAPVRRRPASAWPGHARCPGGLISTRADIAEAGAVMTVYSTRAWSRRSSAQD